MKRLVTNCWVLLKSDCRIEANLGDLIMGNSKFALIFKLDEVYHKGVVWYIFMLFPGDSGFNTLMGFLYGWLVELFGLKSIGTWVERMWGNFVFVERNNHILSSHVLHGVTNHIGLFYISSLPLIKFVWNTFNCLLGFDMSCSMIMGLHFKQVLWILLPHLSSSGWSQVLLTIYGCHSSVRKLKRKFWFCYC